MIVTIRSRKNNKYRVVYDATYISVISSIRIALNGCNDIVFSKNNDRKINRNTPTLRIE